MKWTKIAAGAYKNEYGCMVTDGVGYTLNGEFCGECCGSTCRKILTANKEAAEIASLIEASDGICGELGSCRKGSCASCYASFLRNKGYRNEKVVAEEILELLEKQESLESAISIIKEKFGIKEND